MEPCAYTTGNNTSAKIIVRFNDNTYHEKTPY